MQEASKNEQLRALPQIEEILKAPEMQDLEPAFAHELIVNRARCVVDSYRQQILAGKDGSVSFEEIVSQVRSSVEGLKQSSLRRVINASGVIMHTNLGRSNLADAAIQAVNEVLRGYSTLEYDTQALERGSRHSHYEELLCTLTGAEAALAVNNNAAAVMMVLSEFASGREAIVSRGELVEIGGSFRIPDIMEQSRARMVEVGTTNKTRIDDYEQALSSNTAVLLKVHPSNFRMVGFTENVSIKDLRLLADRMNEQRRLGSLGDSASDSASGSLGGSTGSSPEGSAGSSPEGSSEAQDILVYEDQGSGALLSLECFGSYKEPTVSQSLEQGADLVSFSGDKLLGGPQAGIIVGKKALIQRLKKNPLARALRLDKMSLAALVATLQLYLNKEQALQQIPTLRMLTLPADEVKKEATVLKNLLESMVDASCAQFTVEPELARAGGGSLPMCDIESFAVAVEFRKGSAQKCEEFLVKNRPVPIIVRIKQERVLLDARTLINQSEREEIAQAIKAYFSTLS